MTDKIYSLFDAYKLLYKNEDVVFESEDGKYRLDKSRFCLDWQCGHMVKAVSIEGINHIEKWKLIKQNQTAI